MIYNETKVTDYAAGLERKADRLALSAFLMGGLKGIVIAGLIVAVESSGLFKIPIDTAAVFLAVGALFAWTGYMSGEREGAILRFQAHSIMCAVQIERNTRPHTPMAIEMDQAPIHVPTGVFPIG